MLNNKQYLINNIYNYFITKQITIIPTVFVFPKILTHYTFMMRRNVLSLFFFNGLEITSIIQTVIILCNIHYYTASVRFYDILKKQQNNKIYNNDYYY